VLLELIEQIGPPGHERGVETVPRREIDGFVE
jgi:hypothetical protein